MFSAVEESASLVGKQSRTHFKTGQGWELISPPAPSVPGWYTDVYYAPMIY